MTNKEFTTREKGMIKNTAKTVYPLYEKLYKNEEKLKALADEIEDQRRIIENWEAGIRHLTGGFTTLELVDRELVVIGQKDGKDIRKANFKLKYEDTVIPPYEEVNTITNNPDVTHESINC